MCKIDLQLIDTEVLPKFKNKRFMGISTYFLGNLNEGDIMSHIRKPEVLGLTGKLSPAYIKVSAFFWNFIPLLFFFYWIFLEISYPHFFFNKISL